MNRERTSSASVLLHIYEDKGKWGSGPPFSISHRFPSWYSVSLLDGWKQVPFWQPPTPPCPDPPRGSCRLAAGVGSTVLGMVPSKELISPRIPPWSRSPRHTSSAWCAEAGPPPGWRGAAARSGRARRPALASCKCVTAPSCWCRWPSCGFRLGKEGHDGSEGGPVGYMRDPWGRSEAAADIPSTYGSNHPHGGSVRKKS